VDTEAQPAEAAAAAVPAALAVEHVSVSFGGVRALNDITFQVPPGMVHGLIGPNGAGKTTLFDVVSGIRRPSEGSLQLCGTDVTGTSATARARLGLRRTFQRVQLFNRLSVADNLLVALEYHGGGGGLAADVLALPSRRRLERQRRDRVAEVAEMCGLTPVLDRPAGSLPVAMARQVELGRALVDRPKVLLLDEPTSGLDDAETHRLGDLISLLSYDHQCAVILVEHNVRFVMDHSTRITFLSLGRVVVEGTPAEIRDNAEVQNSYLG
jgi:branched-chain amino acid transport system ATP-binding protein